MKRSTKLLQLAFLLVSEIVMIKSVKAQGLPVSLRTDIKVTKLLDVPTGCSRLARDPVSGHLFFVNQNGDVYEVMNSNGTYTSVLRATATDHGITLLQGMAFKGKSLFLIGNRNADSISYEGKIVKGTLQNTGKRTWTQVMTTEKYGYTNTAYNHGYSGLVVSPDSNYLFISSGSRTDHGEIQTRKGLKTDLREEPLTSAIFRIPINSSNLVLPNDSARLATLGYLYADGTRNSFDLAFGTDGNLYGCENSGDRDDPDELNWIRQGHFYGFPWNLGGNETPMQFAGYNPATDKLLNPNCNGAKKGFFYNDLAYPKKPNRIFTAGIVNIGTDADKVRDPKTGEILDANGTGLKMTTFTSHRSPLGLVFDRDSLLTDEFKGHGFLLGWTAGVSDTSKEIGPFADPGQDLLHVQFIYDNVTDNYRIQTHRIAWKFNNPVDAELVGNIIYVLEYGGSSPKIWKVEMPVPAPCGNQSYVTREQYNNIPGNLVSNLTANKNYPDHPTITTRLTSFESPLNTGDSYGVRIRGYVTAPANGNYTFFLAADDVAELWVSTDATTTHKKKIATVNAYSYSRQYNKYATQKSAPIALKAGTRYYIEALQKENTGGDNLSVSWQLPGGSMETPISCNRLSPFIQSAQAKFTSTDSVAAPTDIVSEELLVYPNPARNAINLKFNASKAHRGEVIVTNFTGLKVYKKTIEVVNGENKININSESLPKGIYIINVTYSGITHSSKVIIE
ncbi:T9SS type A sorting domain-containing protein [Mucilaginibacter sp.]|uniref:T9SS type A sorting domain-containing protein n=1 Tax=Mucilaginibacter sp. TaxID=1882438 RepID=UPI0025D405E4|nr:T9SS type A sorting domain-containing protein [Mucilaginibacter sp.]